MRRTTMFACESSPSNNIADVITKHSTGWPSKRA